MKDLISVIVPVYNVEKYIYQCVDSILNQTYENLEIILVNDGSLDNCGKICDEYAKKDNRIIVIHKENGGVSSARNVGIENSHGKWISFIDSDDWIEKEYFEIMLEQAQSQNAEIIVCGYNKIWGNSVEKINILGKKEIYNSKEYLIKTLNPQSGCGFCHMKLIKKESINNIRFDESLIIGEDALFNMQISKNITKAVFCKIALYNYRNNGNSAVKRYDENYVGKFLFSMKNSKNYIFENFKDKDIQQNYYNFVAYHVMLIAVNYCYHPNNHYKNKRKLLKEVCNIEEFKEGIKKSNYDNISLTRKITLFTLKHKLYLLTGIICNYRQLQNIGGNK